jgi:uncharacterized protein (TIGR00645 family)
MWTQYLERAEQLLEKALFACRWLLAPFYVGLGISLVVMLVKFMEELFHIATHAFSASESEIIVGVLSLVDLALTGSLLIIVIFSGYENFVSRINHANHQDWPSWMGTIDFSALKLKLLSSIVAISAIQLLKQFMEIKKTLNTPTGERELYWYVVVHVVFVVSSVLLALSDRIAGDHGHGHGKANVGDNASTHGSKSVPQADAPVAGAADKSHGHMG